MGRRVHHVLAVVVVQTGKAKHVQRERGCPVFNRVHSAVTVAAFSGTGESRGVQVPVVPPLFAVPLSPHPVPALALGVGFGPTTQGEEVVAIRVFRQTIHVVPVVTHLMNEGLHHLTHPGVISILGHPHPAKAQVDATKTTFYCFAVADDVQGFAIGTGQQSIGVGLTGQQFERGIDGLKLFSEPFSLLIFGIFTLVGHAIGQMNFHISYGDSLNDFLGVGQIAVVQPIAVTAAIDDVDAGVAPQTIEARVATQRVIACLPGQIIVAAAAAQTVRFGAAVKDVVAYFAFERVLSTAAIDRVIAAVAGYPVVPRASVDHIMITAAIEAIRAAAPLQGIVSVAAENGVLILVADQKVPVISLLGSRPAVMDGMVGPVEPVVASPAVQAVLALIAQQSVLIGTAIEPVVARAAVDSIIARIAHGSELGKAGHPQRDTIIAVPAIDVDITVDFDPCGI